MYAYIFRFSTLLERDGLDTYLAEPTDPALCLASLTLLTSLVRSPQLTLRLCPQGGQLMLYIWLYIIEYTYTLKLMSPGEFQTPVCVQLSH